MRDEGMRKDYEEGKMEGEREERGEIGQAEEHT